MPPKTINDYFQPASSKVHSNIDELILQAELDKRQFGGVSYYKGVREEPIDMQKYADLMSKANISGAISEILPNKGLHQPFPMTDDYWEEYKDKNYSKEQQDRAEFNKFLKQQNLKKMEKGIIDRMRLGDAPGGVIAYSTFVDEPDRAAEFSFSKNISTSPDTIRIFKNKGDDYHATSILHEPLHGIDVEGSRRILDASRKKSLPWKESLPLWYNHAKTKLRHTVDKTTQEDFDRYEEKMKKTLSDYYGSEKKAVNQLLSIKPNISNPWKQGYTPSEFTNFPPLNKRYNNMESTKAYLRRRNPYNPMDDILGN